MYDLNDDRLKHDTEAVHLLTLEERDAHFASDSSSFEDSVHDHFDPADHKVSVAPTTQSSWRRRILQRVVDTGASVGSSLNKSLGGRLNTSWMSSSSSSSSSSNSLLANSSKALMPLAVFLLPSFIGDRFIPERRNAPPASVRPTSFLDGMRGVASWAVFNTHLASTLDRNSGSAWGHDDNAYKISKLPITRLIYDGRVAVCIFFVISGFALSLGPVSSMNKSPLDSSTAFRRLCSATFRRPVRLFLPAFASTFIIFTFTRFNVFMNIRAHLTDTDIIRGWEYLNDFPKPIGTWWDQLTDLYINDLRLLQIFNDIGGSGFDDHYNDVLWTIAIEFRASLMLFLSHAALSYLTRRARIVTIILLILAALQAWSFEMPLFWAGFLLAECWVSPRPAAPALPQTLAPGEPGILASESRYRRYGSVAASAFGRFFACTCAVVGAYFASIPGYEPEKTPLWAWLQNVPRFGYFFPGYWTALGSTMIVASVAYIPWLSGPRFFASRPMIYLGKISFSLYLVHISFVRGIGSLIYYWSYSTFGESNSVDSAVSFIVGYFILFSMTIWFADIFCRVVEQPSVTFAKWTEDKLFRKD